MRRSLIVMPLAMLASALALAGCGSSTPTATRAAKVFFNSAAIVNHTIPVQYTCDGKDIVPPLEWGTIPEGTGELLLVAVGLKPNPAGNYSVSVEWALSGVKPSLHRLAAGELPQGSHVGVASNGKRGYSICPKAGSSEQYQFMLYAVPNNVSIAPDFSALPILAAISKQGTKASAIGQGAFIATYKRRRS
jgi:phosphatidylethanolamine-binding protein (PEBP) family uncharacterized protein